MFALMIATAAASMTPSDLSQYRTVNVDGVKATYTRTVEKDGTVLLRGEYQGHGRMPFEYRIKDGKVEALIDGEKHRFPAPSSGR